MRRMVVTTARGHVVTDEKVTEEKIVDAVSKWMQAVPDCGVYLDGTLISDEVRLAMLGQPLARAAAPAPASLPEPAEIRSYAEALQHAFAGLCGGYVDLLRLTQGCVKEHSELCLDRERRSADEAARQRELTHKSLKDIDLLDRSVAAARLKDNLAAAGAQSMARVRRDGRMQLGDVLMGVVKTLMGDAK